jgi:hypothetical protein
MTRPDPTRPAGTYKNADPTRPAGRPDLRPTLRQTNQLVKYSNIIKLGINFV